ncbi:hypothetical protein AVEN_219219-1 [Araneus ventricosus]|uniref:Uncharacterized protein n=1 Tax=Araneus ventricosus TaxID=182803 RepID=A0A4Y2R7S9_ARAVE|nr:hypothetical protein AVEN_219219-1 [Araneus ventricosus]
MTACIVRIVRKLSSSPNTSGRATRTKKARSAKVKSITLNERGLKFQSDIRTFRTAIVFCLKARMGRSHIDRIKEELTRSDATLGLFWDGSCHFELRSYDKDDTRPGQTSHHTSGRTFGLLRMI